MLELGIVSGVGTLGYLLNQQERKKNFEHNNNESLPKYLQHHPYQRALAQIPAYGYENTCADTFPLYSPEYVRHQQRVVSGLPGPQTGERGLPKMEEFANFIPANDPDSEQLLDLPNRPLTDFYHNNMVPFYGSNVTQNMAGTGVASGSYIDGSNVPGNITGVNSGFDYTTPNQTTLATFTGVDDTYIHKREIGPMFSPAEQQTNWMLGTMPLFRPDLDRYTQGLSNIRNDLRPVEPEMVGPGLNLDPKIPASGGFHDFTRILPNNVSDYKANQLPGQVITGKLFSAGLPTSYPGIGIEGDKVAPGVTKNRPNKFWDQVRLPTMTTKVGFQGNLDYNIPQYQVDFRPKNATRDQTSYGLGNLEYKRAQTDVCVNQEVSIGQGPLGASVPQTPARSETFMSQDNNVRSRSDCNSQPIGNPERSQFGFGNILSNWYVNQTDRGTINPQSILQVGLSAERQGSTFWTYEDEARTTTKDTTSFAYAGNTARGDMGQTFYTYEDEPKTTTKDTTSFAYAGNTARGDMGQTFYTFEDEPRSTNKETTQFAYSGSPNMQGFAEMNRSQFTGFGDDS